ncbi:ABC transporter substrate-binding protein [Candidatus Lokiarchaeum ossiferum]|uniref:ABC transporter substrate-binding protein n=1 Tax=Candidatus Lokiarchaeum ossiferum TaxID=2951803 RepID=UPI00352F6E04
MKILKKILLFSLLCFVLIPSTTSNIAQMDTTPSSAAGELRPLIYGVNSLVVDMEPQFAWDSASCDFIGQICEGLFAYDIDDPSMAIIPKLATGFGTWDLGSPGFHTDQWTYTVDIRTGVKFHDGSDFTAEDVVFTFDRLNGFCTNDPITQISELYKPLESVYWATPLLINKTEALGDYTVRFTLNYKYIPFEALLCFTGSSILSSYPGSTPVDMYDVSTDTLIGTGPYQQISNTPDQTVFSFFEDYYGPTPTIQDMTWIRYDETSKMNEDFLFGDIDFVSSIEKDFAWEYELSPNHYLTAPMQGTVIIYLGFNCDEVDINTRRAMQDAVDYSYIIEELGEGQLAPMTSVIPKGIMYHDSSIPAPIMNLTAARLHMLDAILAGEQGIVPGGYGLNESSTDQDWESVTLVSYNYYYNTGNTMRENVGNVVKDNFAKIGINLVIEGKTWGEFLDALYGGEGSCQVFMLGWGPDYNDPSNFINPLFSNTSGSNLVHLNDASLMAKMEAGLIEQNLTLREQLYHEMQQDIIDLAPWAFLYTSNSQGIYSTEISDPKRNPMGTLRFYEMTWTGEIRFDADNDGLWDEKEMQLGTDPNNPDSDFDGCWDRIEAKGGTNPLDASDFIGEDTDEDGFSNTLEQVVGTNPLDPFDNPGDDIDGDGLSDVQEWYYHTNKRNPDTDGDGYTDGDEMDDGTDPLNPLDFIGIDSDGDGFSNDVEYAVGTNPFSGDNHPGLDSDGDGLSMLYEWYCGTNPNSVDTDGDGYSDLVEVLSAFYEEWDIDISDPTNSTITPMDSDNDYLADYEEIYIYLTNFVESDTDADGIMDGVEVHQYGTDPTLLDSDADGLDDRSEIDLYYTNPLCIDSDNDNLNDNFEIKLGTNPLDDDTDNDGYFDGYEVKMGKDPRDAGSFPGDGQDSSTTTETTETSESSDTMSTMRDNPFENIFANIPGYSTVFLLFGGILAIFSIFIQLKKNRK